MGKRGVRGVLTGLTGTLTTIKKRLPHNGGKVKKEKLFVGILEEDLVSLIGTQGNREEITGENILLSIAKRFKQVILVSGSFLFPV